MQSQFAGTPSAIGRPSRREQPIPLTKTIDDTCRITGLGRTKVYDLIATGRLKTTAVGRRRLVFYASIEALLRGEDVR
jgi:excisionase family DNA binding protein